MIGPTGAVRVMVATKPVDFRKGAEGLAALVREEMKADPFDGRGLRVPRQARGPGEADLLGRDGRVSVRQAARGRRVPLAEDRGWRDATDGGAAVRAARRSRLAARARSEGNVRRRALPG